MISAVVCPHPPLLLRELTGTDDPGLELREACVLALKRALASAPERVHLIGAADERGPWSPGGLPLSLTVGDRLLDLAGWTGERVHHVVPDPDGSPVDLPDDRSLAVFLADGSARRGERAPGHLDERAAPFDAAIEAALREGRADVLATLDAPLGAQLLAQGVPVLRVLGTLASRLGVRSAEIGFSGDPFGVSYWVATWDFEPLGSRSGQSV